MRFEFFKQLMRQTRNDFLVRYKSSIKLLEGNNKKIHKFKNIHIQKMNVNTEVASLKIKFADFDNLLIAMNIGGAPITQSPLFTNLNDVEEWNDFWGSGGSNSIFDSVIVDEENFEVTLSGNIDAITYLGYTSFDVKIIGLEIVGFTNLEEFYIDENPLEYVIIDNPRVINYLALNNTSLNDNNMRDVLEVMSNSDIENGSIDFSGYQTFIPDSITLDYITNLEGKGWSVSY